MISRAHPDHPEYKMIGMVEAMSKYGHEHISEEQLAEAVMVANVVHEKRITDPVTGGEKGRKSAQLGALDPASLMRVAEVAGFGSMKYDRMNFTKGYSWSLSYDALQRHLHAFWNGENLDEESGLPHLAHAAWHCLALITFSERERGTDDRISNLPHMQRPASG